MTAWVVLADGHGFDEAALIAHGRTLLAGYKCPKRVFQAGGAAPQPAGQDRPQRFGVSPDQVLCHDKPGPVARQAYLCSIQP